MLLGMLARGGLNRDSRTSDSNRPNGVRDRFLKREAHLSPKLLVVKQMLSDYSTVPADVPLFSWHAFEAKA